jgi:hypothetical protein
MRARTWTTIRRWQQVTLTVLWCVVGVGLLRGGELEDGWVGLAWAAVIVVMLFGHAAQDRGGTPDDREATTGDEPAET